jgi:arylsulfatase A-like enzyme
LRGGKGSPWEGGFRVPFAVQWTGHLPKGLRFEKPVISLDIFATIAALADAPANPDRPLDGVNLMPYLTGQQSGDPHDAIYLRMFDRGAFAVRSGEHKLVIPGKGREPELYSLTRDIGESKNLAAAEPAVVKELEKRRVAWNQQLVEPVFEGLLQINPKKPVGPAPAD